MVARAALWRGSGDHDAASDDRQGPRTPLTVRAELIYR